MFSRWLIIERLFVLPQGRTIVGLRHGKSWRQITIEQSSALEFGKAREIANSIEAEMLKEQFGGAIGDRPPRRAPSSTQSDPPNFEKHVERALRGANTPDLLYFSARDGLMIGDDRKRFERSFRKLSLFD